MMLKLFRAAALALLAATTMTAVTACAPTAQNTRQSLAEEQARSARLLRDLDSKGAIIKTKRLNNYVRGIVTRVAKSRAPGSVPLQAYIVKDADVNAFTTGGGYLFFNAGMLAALENEAQLATVTAHEIAHIDRGHVQAGQANRTGVQLGAAIAGIAAAAAGVSPNLAQPLIGLGAQGFSSNFSRTQETDADNVGIQYLAKAGYNAVEGARSFAVLRRLYGNGGGFLASHPATADRQTNLTRQAQSLGATRGRIGKKSHDRATRSIRKEILKFYDSAGRKREAAQIRRNLR